MFLFSAQRKATIDTWWSSRRGSIYSPHPASKMGYNCNETITNRQTKRPQNDTEAVRVFSSRGGNVSSKAFNCQKEKGVRAQNFKASEVTTRCTKNNDLSSFTSKIAFVLSCCSTYSREHPERLVANGGIQALVTLNEEYLDRVALCPSIDPQERMLEWKVLLNIWEIFESISDKLVLYEGHEMIQDASLDTLEYLQGIQEEVESLSSFTPNILRKVFVTLHNCLFVYRSGNLPVQHNRILPICLRSLRDFFGRDQNESSHENEAITNLSRVAFRFIVDFTAKSWSHSILKGDEHTCDMEFQHVIRFLVEQIQQHPNLALTRGIFCTMVRICINRSEAGFSRNAAGLATKLNMIAESNNVEETLREACEALLGHFEDH